MLVIVGGLMAYRYSRPQKMTLTRMWIMPIVYTGLSAFAIWGGQQMNPVASWEIAVAVIGGIILGAPLGILRGKHTNVRATETPGVMYLDVGWVVPALWLGSFAARAGIRALLPHGSIATIIGDGLLVFAMATIIVSYYEIYAKYRALEHEAGQI